MVHRKRIPQASSNNLGQVDINRAGGGQYIIGMIEVD